MSVDLEDCQLNNDCLGIAINKYIRTIVIVIVIKLLQEMC